MASNTEDLRRRAALVNLAAKKPSESDTPTELVVINHDAEDAADGADDETAEGEQPEDKLVSMLDSLSDEQRAALVKILLRVLGSDAKPSKKGMLPDTQPTE
jgi:DNA-directed RNA polymerase specialized sigma24 family protein